MLTHAQDEMRVVRCRIPNVLKRAEVTDKNLTPARLFLRNLDYHTDLSDNSKPAIANVIMGLAKINRVSMI